MCSLDSFRIRRPNAIFSKTLRNINNKDFKKKISQRKSIIKTKKIKKQNQDIMVKKPRQRTKKFVGISDCIEPARITKDNWCRKCILETKPKLFPPVSFLLNQ